MIGARISAVGVGADREAIVVRHDLPRLTPVLGG